MVRRPDGSFRTLIPARGFSLDLTFRPRQPAMANGQNGYSRKGSKAEQASYYYSIPHLRVSGTVLRGGKRVAVTGEAWLDREWSSTLLPKDAVGWDWAGINLDDGGALMAFQVRGGNGQSHLCRWHLSARRWTPDGACPGPGALPPPPSLAIPGERR
jgi:predicted secreted hydrolase